MPAEIHEVKEVRDNGAMSSVQTTHITDDMPETVPAENDGSVLAARIVWWFAGVLLALLAFRFVLVLLGANPANAFANLIYTMSHPFAAPFFGLFGYSLQYGVSRFELSTLIAMAVYAIVAAGIVRLLTIKRS